MAHKDTERALRAQDRDSEPTHRRPGLPAPSPTSPIPEEPGWRPPTSLCTSPQEAGSSHRGRPSTKSWDGMTCRFLPPAQGSRCFIFPLLREQDRASAFFSVGSRPSRAFGETMGSRDPPPRLAPCWHLRFAPGASAKVEHGVLQGLRAHPGYAWAAGSHPVSARVAASGSQEQALGLPG